MRFYGPPDLIKNVEGKLQGYTWNLVDGYPLMIEVREFHQHEIKVATFHAGEGFALQPNESHSLDRSGVFTMLQDPMFSIRSVALNHRIPSLAFALQEQFHININKERLHAAGLPVGSWLKEVKQYLWQGRPDDFRFLATLYFEHRKEVREFVLGQLRDQFTTITRGQKIAYVVDCRFDPENEEKIVELAKGADLFFCEAPYLRRDADKAYDRHHLTAQQAGILAKKAGARDLVVFHFSPRYTGMGDMIIREAQEAFKERNAVSSELMISGGL